MTLRCAGHTRMHFQCYRDKPGIPNVTETNRETPENYLSGIKGCSFRKAMWLAGQLRCLYTSACSVGSRQEELETILLTESYDPVVT